MLEKIQYKMEDAMSDGIFTFMKPNLETMVYKSFDNGVSHWHISIWMQIVNDTKPKKK
jgi:hypothetical protein